MAVVATSISYVYIRGNKGETWKIPIFHVPGTTVQQVNAGANFEGSLLYDRERGSSGAYMSGLYLPGENVFTYNTVNVRVVTLTGGNRALQFADGTGGNMVAPFIQEFNLNDHDNHTLNVPAIIHRLGDDRYFISNNTGSGVYKASEWGWIKPTAGSLGYYVAPTNMYTRVFTYSEASEPLADYIMGNGSDRPNTDPLTPPDGPSGPGGGDGTFDFDSTPIDFQDPPNIGAMDAGFINLYVPSSGQLKALASYMWAGAFDVDNFKKLFADPMDAIIGMKIVPVTAAQIGVAGATLAVGNISTGLVMPKALSQYVVINCGTIEILPKWGAYLDFAPYSKLQLFLPYIGFVPLSPDDCMNGTISVRYTVDIFSGACVAQVKCNDHVLYEFGGVCSCECPVTSGQYLNGAIGVLRIVGSVASTIGGMATGVATSGGSNNSKEASGGLSVGAMGSVTSFTSGAESVFGTVQDMLKPDISRSGGVGSSVGIMGHQIPYLVLTVPKMCIPGYQDSMIGYPSYVTKLLSDLTGFVSVASVHLKGILGASENDLAEIENLLQGGVYV